MKVDIRTHLPSTTLCCLKVLSIFLFPVLLVLLILHQETWEPSYTTWPGAQKMEKTKVQLNRASFLKNNLLRY